jgi:hypothetical protein
MYTSVVVTYPSSFVIAGVMVYNYTREMEKHQNAQGHNIHMSKEDVKEAQEERNEE